MLLRALAEACSSRHQQSLSSSSQYPTFRSDLLLSWLEFVSHIEQGGVRPYEGLTLRDESDSLVPFVLAGYEATTTLADYVPERQAPRDSRPCPRSPEKAGPDARRARQEVR